MRLGPSALRRVGYPAALRGGVITRPGGAAPGPDLSAYDFYDDFNRAAGPINGSAALKGGNWGVTGTGAATAVLDGAGHVAQTAAGAVDYIYNASAMPRIQKRVTCSWYFAGAVDNPICVAILTNNTFVAAKALHGAMNAGNVDFTLLDQATNVFLAPAWLVRGPNWTLQSGEMYTADLVSDGMWCRLSLYDHTGAQVGAQLSYDPDMSTYAGLYQFFEHYLSQSAKADWFGAQPNLPNGWTWPTLNIINPNGSTGWSALTGFTSPFGGSATPGTGKITFAGAGFGQGGAVSIGNLALNDVVSWSIDASNWSGLHAFVGLVRSDGTVMSNLTAVTGNGRWQGAATCTLAGAVNFIICGTNMPENNTYSVDVSTKFLMVKNPPLAP